MTLHALAFYLFSIVLLLAAVMVISARNPVHSVLYLILTFFNAAALFILIGAEFLAMILVVIYVGAVAVLFLFVIMMLDINRAELRQGFLHYMPIGASISLVLLLELILVASGWQFEFADSTIGAPVPALLDRSNTAALGGILYTRYVFLFQSAGIVLLIAMIGAIVLTLRHRGVRRQRTVDQVGRRPEDMVNIRKVPSGEGI